jgi:two-component system chemotaxis response regulator CheB
MTPRRDDGGVRAAIGIGASAGGVDALTEIVRGLPPELDACVLIILHLPAAGPSLLSRILGRHSRLPVAQAQDGEPLLAGHVLVAPPDRHLLVVDGRLRLDAGPKENGARPAIDPTLRSLAAAYGPRAIAVILSGALGDGAHGALAVAAAGGGVIVQDPHDALVTSMPRHAIDAVGAAATVLHLDKIAPELVRRTAAVEEEDVPA